MVTSTSGCSALNSSATASVIGYTVLDPSIDIAPEPVPAASSFLLFPQDKSVNTTAALKRIFFIEFVLFNKLLSIGAIINCTVKPDCIIVETKGCEKCFQAGINRSRSCREVHIVKDA